MIRILRNFGQLADLPLSDASLMEEIGLLVARRIRSRTEQSRDYVGFPFAPLSPGYAKAKQRALGHSRADLTVSGRMLNDMGVTEATATSVMIGFRSAGGRPPRGGTFIQRSRAVGAADKAYWHHVTGAGGRTRRQFFDVADAELDEAVAAVDRYLDEVL